MPVDVAVKEPRTWVVSEEPNRDIVCVTADAHDVTDHRIDIIVGRVTSAADNVECVSVQVDRMLVNHKPSTPPGIGHARLSALTGPPAIFPGIVISTLLFLSRP